MATEKINYEIEEGATQCSNCPFRRLDSDNCHLYFYDLFKQRCNEIDVNTFKKQNKSVGDDTMYSNEDSYK